MGPRLLHPDEYELLGRPSLESNESFDIDEADPETQSLTKSIRLQHTPRITDRILSIFPSALRRKVNPSSPKSPRRTKQHVNCARRPSLLRLCYIFHAFLGIIVVVVLLMGLFRPSYTHRPELYDDLKRRALTSKTPGRANIHGEKVFIAASIYDPDGQLADGAWGKAVLDLISMLGEDNVFLSIYENDSGSVAAEALQRLKENVKCNKSIVFEESLDQSELPHVILPDGSHRIKRIAYLAEVRNRALKPLDKPSEVKYDKVLYLNDVIFKPEEAAQLLFLTNADEHGRPEYIAACAVDFINPFKFYDTFASRDLDGFSMGIPFFPWFTNAGSGFSREDVLDQSDAVRVQSCWGGMVAFDARYLQEGNNDKDHLLGRPWEPRTFPTVRFRAEKDLYWDASECCLIHADMMYPIAPADELADTHIYMNPYIRVAYDENTLSWLGATRRFERLYSPIHNILNHMVGLPWYNSRRGELPGDEVEEQVWVPDSTAQGNGTFQTVKRVATNSGYCGRRALQVLREHPQPGQKNWELLPVPAVKG
jgi:hypothetical protein